MHTGRDDYDVLYPSALAVDLNQNPHQRARKSETVLATLTTGASRVWLTTCKRFLTGTECLALHSIPVTFQIARAMKCARVRADVVSNTMQSFLAGNSMHCASVGAAVALCLFGMCSQGS